MQKELTIKKCTSCGALVKVFQDCKCNNCGIQCCGTEMETLVPNSVDAAFEKHVPTYEIVDGKLHVKVNHVMDDDHFIEWITIVSDGKEITRYFTPGQEAIVNCCKYIPGTKLYAYCNKHGLWSTTIE